MNRKQLYRRIMLVALLCLPMLLQAQERLDSIFKMASNAIGIQNLKGITIKKYDDARLMIMEYNYEASRYRSVSHTIDSIYCEIDRLPVIHSFREKLDSCGVHMSRYVVTFRPTNEQGLPEHRLVIKADTTSMKITSITPIAIPAKEPMTATGTEAFHQRWLALKTKATRTKMMKFDSRASATTFRMNLERKRMKSAGERIFIEGAVTVDFMAECNAMKRAGKESCSFTVNNAEHKAALAINVEGGGKRIYAVELKHNGLYAIWLEAEADDGTLLPTDWTKE